MLAQAEMLVVIVIEETITLCTQECVTAENIPEMVLVSLKVPQRRAALETKQVERVNPSS